MDKYDACKNIMKFIEWLVENNKARLLDGRFTLDVEHRNYDRYWGLQIGSVREEKEISPEEILMCIKNEDTESVKFKIEYEGKIYSLNDFYAVYNQYVMNIKQTDGLNVLGTTTPRYEIPENGTAMWKTGENRYIVVNREKIIREYKKRNI